MTLQPQSRSRTKISWIRLMAGPFGCPPPAAWTSQFPPRQLNNSQPWFNHHYMAQHLYCGATNKWIDIINSRMQLKSSDGVCGCKINAVNTLMGNFYGGPWLLPAVNWRIVCPDPAFVWSVRDLQPLASLSSWNLQPLDQMPALPPTQSWQHDGDNIWSWPALIRLMTSPRVPDIWQWSSQVTNVIVVSAGWLSPCNLSLY